MEEIPAGGYSYIYLVGDFSFGRLPEDEQLCMAGLGECPLGSLHPEDEEVTGFVCGTPGIVKEVAVSPVDLHE